MIKDWNKRYKLELTGHEMNILFGGLGHYYDYLEKIKKKEKIERRKQLEQTQERIDDLRDFFSKTLFG